MDSNGAMTKSALLASVQQILTATLTLGDNIIVIESIAWTSSAVRAVIEAAGCQLLYLPAYSAIFIPSKKLEPRLKPLLRIKSTRTFQTLSATTLASLTFSNPKTGLNE